MDTPVSKFSGNKERLAFLKDYIRKHPLHDSTVINEALVQAGFTTVSRERIRQIKDGIESRPEERKRRRTVGKTKALVEVNLPHVHSRQQLIQVLSGEGISRSKHTISTLGNAYGVKADPRDIPAETQTIIELLKTNPDLSNAEITAHMEDIGRAVHAAEIRNARSRLGTFKPKYKKQEWPIRPALVAYLVTHPNATFDEVSTALNTTVSTLPKHVYKSVQRGIDTRTHPTLVKQLRSAFSKASRLTLCESFTKSVTRSDRGVTLMLVKEIDPTIYDVLVEYAAQERLEIPKVRDTVNKSLKDLFGKWAGGNVPKDATYSSALPRLHVAITKWARHLRKTR